MKTKPAFVKVLVMCHMKKKKSMLNYISKFTFNI